MYRIDKITLLLVTATLAVETLSNVGSNLTLVRQFWRRGIEWPKPRWRLVFPPDWIWGTVLGGAQPFP